MRITSIGLRLQQAGVLAILAFPGAAFAAPFCIQNQSVPPQCIYDDASSCQHEAMRQGGVCSANAKQLALQPGLGQYCVVTSSLVSMCIYPDRGSCTAEAARQHGACVAAPNVAPARTPDPYAAVGGL